MDLANGETKSTQDKATNTDDELGKTVEQVTEKSRNALKEKGFIRKRINLYTIYCLFIALIGSSFQYGWNISVFNTSFETIKSFYGDVYENKYNATMSDGQFTLLWSISNALNPFGGIIGALLSGVVADKLGRKRGLLITNVFVACNAFFIIISKFINSIVTFMIGRFFSGVLSGLYSSLIALYLDEMAPPKYRGSIGVLNPLFVAASQFIVSILGLPFLLGNPLLWPVLSAIPLLPSFAQLGLIFAVETPKYTFINKKNEKKALKDLKRLRGKKSQEEIDKELEALRMEKQRTASRKKVRLYHFAIRRILMRPLIIACALNVAQQLSGINAFNFYSTSIFINIGLVNGWPMYFSAFLNVVQFSTTFLSVFLVERVGRRILLLFGLIGMCISATMISVTRIITQISLWAWMNYITVFFSFVYQFCYSLGPYSVTSLITLEFFDTDTRGRASSITVTVNWLFNFLVTITFPFIEQTLKSFSFLVFGGSLLFFSIFTFIFVPETKNKSIAQIQDHFDKGWLAIGRKKQNNQNGEFSSENNEAESSSNQEVQTDEQPNETDSDVKSYKTASSNAEVYSVIEV